MNAKNPKEHSENLNQQFQLLEKTLISLVHSYVDLFLGRIPSVEHPVYNIRHSILYRSDCIYFHLKLLIQLQKDILAKISSDFGNIDINHPVMVYGEKQQLYLFDDIVFHTISLYDYLGSLIGLLYFGQNKMNLKWNGIHDAAHDKGNKFSESSIAYLIITHHKEWVNLLLEYRSHLIHSKSDKADGEYTITGTMEYIENRFTVGVPKRFSKKFRKKIDDIISQTKERELTLIDVAVWLVNTSIQIVNEIISCAKQEKENEWNRRKTPQKKSRRKRAESSSVTIGD